MKILVVDDMAIVRDPIAAALSAAGHETQCASTGKEALLITKSTPPDLILLDIHLPDMSGLQIVRAIRNTPSLARLPIVLLSAEQGRESVLLAAQLGVQGYILKSQFSLKELLNQVERAPSLANLEESSNVNRSSQPETNSDAPISKAVPQLLTRNQFLERTKSAMQAKTLSGVVTQVISLATAPRTELADLAVVVSRDTVLATRVLQAANSAAYRSAKGTVTTIADAIRQVGCSTIRNIASAVGIFEAMPETSADGFNPIRCWQHSFAVAQICETLASSGGLNPGMAYLIGLCHDLGEIVLHTQFGNEYRQIIEAQKNTGRTREELELHMLGMSHSELVSTILRCFGLPDAVRAPIEWFHANMKSSSLGSPHSMEGILRIAEWYANGLMLASSEYAGLNLITADQFRSAVGTQNPPRPDTQKLRGEIMALTGMLARLSPPEEAELMRPLFPEIDRKLWIARDASLSALDPVSAALSGIARAQIRERLPTVAERAELDGLVVLGERTIQDAAVAASNMQPSQMLRVLPACARPNDATSFYCPITLDQLNRFCREIPSRKKAA